MNPRWRDVAHCVRQILELATQAVESRLRQQALVVIWIVAVVPAMGCLPSSATANGAQEVRGCCLSRFLSAAFVSLAFFCLCALLLSFLPFLSPMG